MFRIFLFLALRQLLLKFIQHHIQGGCDITRYLKKIKVQKAKSTDIPYVQIQGSYVTALYVPHVNHLMHKILGNTLLVFADHFKCMFVLRFKGGVCFAYHFKAFPYICIRCLLSIATLFPAAFK